VHDAKEEYEKVNHTEYRKLKEELKNIRKDFSELQEKYELLKKVNALLENNYKLLTQKRKK
jgi:hypothetical protein